MHQLVQQDVLSNEGRCLNESPVERDRAVWRTSSPPRTLIANRNAWHMDPVNVGKRQQHGWQFPSCPRLHPSLDDGPEVIGVARGRGDEDIAAPYPIDIALPLDAKLLQLSIHEDARSVLPSRRRRGHDVRTRALPSNPLATRGDERFGLAPDAPARKRDAQRTVAEHAQDVTARTAMTHEDDGTSRNRGVASQRQSQLHGGLR